ncbi:hypothetical protein [Rhodococcus sp. USK10]|uniref:hypothetical protein n=1 Tax=Rhodococcus sp. USK10 TaxID=2789739 RepID=UPI00215096E3|nr:hypothetical protein [Rhodococcus sp. USK10]
MTQAPLTRPGSHDDLGGALAAALPERMRDGVLAYRQVSVMFDVVGLGRWVVCTRFGTVSGETRIRGGRRPPPAHDHRPAGAVVALPGCGHLPQFEWPEATGAPIDEFLIRTAFHSHTGVTA